MNAKEPLPAHDTPTGVPASFALVWNAIADVLGTAATAALVRRAARRASAAHPALGELTIERKCFTPAYGLPQPWLERPADPAITAEFQALLDELVALLYQLTGAVVVHRLAQLHLPSGRVGMPVPRTRM